MTFIYLAIGASLVALGFALVRVINILRAPYRSARTTEPGPILLPEFRSGDSQHRENPPSRS